MPSPIKVVGEEHPLPTKAPDAGQHTDVILREVLGYADERIAALRDAGALGYPAGQRAALAAERRGDPLVEALDLVGSR